MKRVSSHSNHANNDEAHSRSFMGQSVEPYRYLFTIGALNAVLGAAVWILYAVSLIPYPARIHPMLMSGGFMTSMVLGFLWTALPRFTQATLTRYRDVFPVVVMQLSVTIAAMYNAIDLAYLFLSVSMLFTLRFSERCFTNARQNSPPSFLFIRSGVILGALSILVLFVQDVSPGGLVLSSTLVGYARLFFIKGFTLFQLIGVGSRLMPAILGTGLADRIMIDTEADGSLLQRYFFRYGRTSALILVIVSAFAYEAAGLTQTAALLLLVSLGSVVLHDFRAASIRSRPQGIAMFVWLGALCMPLAPLLVLIQPQFALHLWHVEFIGAIGLITLMVGIRVSVSHSGFAQTHIEERHASIPWMGWLIGAAMLTRISVSWFPDMALSHYTYAAVLWIIASVVWSYRVMLYSAIAEYRRLQQFRHQPPSANHG